MKLPKNPQGILEEARNDRMNREMSWDKVNLFLRGFQWLRTPVEGDTTWKRLDAKEGSALFVTVNKMLPYMRSAQARLTLAFPGVNVLPADNSQEDILKAMVSAEILRFWWHAAGLDMVGFDGSRYLINYGSYALHEYYEPAKGEDPERPDGSGNIKVEAISPYNWFLEPGSSELSESEYVMLRSYVTKSDLKKDYPGRRALNNLTPTDKDHNTIRANKKREINRFEKVEWYFKDGTHGVSVGDTWLESTQKYFNPKFFPVQIIYYTKLDDQPYGMGIMEPLTQLQWLYNWSRTRTARNLAKVGFAKLMAPKGSIMKASDWNDRAGGIVTYNESAGKPWIWAPSVNTGQEVDQSLRISAEMDDVAGIHSVSRGKQVPGMRSGKAIEALAGTDSADLIPTVTLIENGFKQCFEVSLHLHKKHFKKKRMLRAWDSYGGAIFKTISNTDIVDDPDVFIEAGSMFKDSTEKRRADILELFQLQLIERDEAVEALGNNIGTHRKLMEKIQSMRKALDAIDHIRAGKGPIRLFASDDLKAYRKVFSEFMSSPAFEDLNPLQQEYIGNVIATIDTHGQPDEAFQRASALQQVLPRASGVQPGPGTGQAVQSGPGLAQRPSDVESAEQVQARRGNASPIGRRF